MMEKVTVSAPELHAILFFLGNFPYDIVKDMPPELINAISKVITEYNTAATIWKAKQP